jgi:deoxyadenosine/deoxycytidine kinase
MSYRFIAVEGNIGVGKTTLSRMIAQHYNSRLILEEFVDNNFLPKFYNNPERFAFPLELSFLADRYKQLKNLINNQDLFQDSIVSDYLFIKSKLFAKINLKEEEYDLFQRLFDIIQLQLPEPDLLIFLDAPIPKLQENIQNRGRAFEMDIEDTYLSKVNKVYAEYLKTINVKVLYINMSEFDFLNNPSDFDKLVHFIDHPTTHSINHL